MEKFVGWDVLITLENIVGWYACPLPYCPLPYKIEMCNPKQICLSLGDPKCKMQYEVLIQNAKA